MDTNQSKSLKRENEMEYKFSIVSIYKIKSLKHVYFQA
jgi:hypothetical protein